MATTCGLPSQGEELQDESVREMIRELQGDDQTQMRGALLTLCDACRSENPFAQANRATLLKAGGVSQLVEMLVDKTTTIGQVDQRGVDKHSFTQYVVHILRDLAQQGAGGDDGSAIHAQMIFVGLPDWLAEYLQSIAEAKRSSSIFIGMTGRVSKPQPVWGAMWSGSSKATDQLVTATTAQQLVLLLAASASGIEGLLHAGLAQVLADEIEAAPAKLTGMVLAAAAMVLKYHHECTGAVEAARVASVGGQGYSKLVDAAGTAVQNEVAALVEDIRGGPKENDYITAAEELVRLSLFSETFVETVAMKLLPALNGMIQSDHAELVSRASKVVAVISEDSSSLATLLCSSGLLETVVRCLTPMPRYSNQMVSHRHAQDAFVSPKTRLYLLEMLATISLPTASKSPYSILLQSISSWSVVRADEGEQAHGSYAKMSVCELLDDMTTAFRVEAERSQLALGPLAHFVTVISFMVLQPSIQQLIADRPELVELLLAHSWINAVGVLALVTILDTEIGDKREGALWSLRRVSSLDCALEEDPAVSFQIALGLGFLVAQPEFTAYVLRMELVPVLLSLLETQGSEFLKTRQESARVLSAMLQDTSLSWDDEQAQLRHDVEEAVTRASLLVDEEESRCSDSQENRRTKLPDGWEARESATTGEYYYFNMVTGESQWDHPHSLLTNSKKRDSDQVKVTDARDMSSGESEDESEEEESHAGTGKKIIEHEAAASVQMSPEKNDTSTNSCTVADVFAVGRQSRQPDQQILQDLKTEVTASKRAQQTAEAETERLKQELASFRQERMAQETAESEANKVMSEEAADAKRAQQAAEKEAARLAEELAAAIRAQEVAEAETARIRKARVASTAVTDGETPVVPLHKYQELQQLVESLEQRMTYLETPGVRARETCDEGDPVEPQQDGMSLHDFLLRYRLESYEVGLQELGVVVPEHLCDVDEADLETLGMNRLEIVRFRTACDLLGELDDL